MASNAEAARLAAAERGAAAIAGQNAAAIYGLDVLVPHIEDELTSYRVDAIREGEAWWFSSWGFGINYSDRTKDKKTPESGTRTLVYGVSLEDA